MSASVGDVPARLAVLEEIASTTKTPLERIERRLDSMDERLQTVETGVVGPRERIEGRGARLDALPTIWQMITTVIGGQVALAAVVIAAMRFAPH